MATWCRLLIQLTLSGFVSPLYIALYTFATQTSTTLPTFLAGRSVGRCPNAAGTTKFTERTSMKGRCFLVQNQSLSSHSSVVKGRCFLAQTQSLSSHSSLVKGHIKRVAPLIITPCLPQVPLTIRRTSKLHGHSIDDSGGVEEAATGIEPKWSLPRTEGNSGNAAIFEDFSYEGYSVFGALMKTVTSFHRCDVPEAKLSACHIMSHVLKLPSSNGFSKLLKLLDLDDKENIVEYEGKTNFNRNLTEEEAALYGDMCIRRAYSHEPIQYLLGEWDFFDFTLKCRRPILCPRPETEELVDWVMKDIMLDLGRLASQRSSCKDKAVHPGSLQGFRILDVGCGTGAIGLALAKRFPQAQVVAIDISPDAVALSMENAALLGLLDGNGSPRYRAILCSAQDFSRKDVANENSLTKTWTFKFDYVVSNPPYIPPGDMHSLTRDVLDHESREALCGGDSADGLDVVRDIVHRLPEWCAGAASGKGELWMEVDTSHPRLLQQWLGLEKGVRGESKEGVNVQFVECRKDMCGRDRFVKLRVKEGNDRSF